MSLAEYVPNVAQLVQELLKSSPMGAPLPVNSHDLELFSNDLCLAKHL